MRSSWLLPVVGVVGCLEVTPGYGDAGATGTGGGSERGSQDGSTDDGDAGDSAHGTGGSSGMDSRTHTAATLSASGTSGRSTGPAVTTSSRGTSGRSTGNTTGTSGPGTTLSGSGTTGASWHRAFATSTTTPGNFGGLAGGNGICNDRAASAGLDGTFRALLSDASTDARDRIVLTGPVRNMLGEIVATDTADLWDGTILGTIDYDENGVELQIAALAWTGSAADGTSASSCADWTSAESSDFGTQGDLTATDDKWVANNDGRCNREHHLYCVEQ
jgi:hypothetical protein